MSAPALPDHAPTPLRQSRVLGSQREIEEYFQRLNDQSPVAVRQIARWARGDGLDSMQVAAVPLPEQVLGTRYAFLGDSHLSFAAEIRAAQKVPDNTPYSVGLLLSGAMRVETSGGVHSVRAGEGLIIDPASVERTWIDNDTHMIELALPKTIMRRLCAEWAADNALGLPRFQPVLRGDLAPRLLRMGTEAAQALESCPGLPGRGEALFMRWLEMIGLTLLNEQTLTPSGQAPTVTGTPAPVAIRRALDFIEAHAGQDILLADVANAACVSVSSLLRLFNRHLGQTPAAVLRDLRLDRARNELRSGPPGAVREVALRWGFQSPSQFTQAYQRRFGEKPSEARSRS